MFKQITFTLIMTAVTVNAWLNDGGTPSPANFCVNGTDATLSIENQACTGGTTYSHPGTFANHTDCFAECIAFHDGSELLVSDKYLLACSCDSANSLTIHYGSTGNEFVDTIVEAGSSCLACQACFETSECNAGQCGGGYCTCDYPDSGWRCGDVTDCTCP